MKHLKRLLALSDFSIGDTTYSSGQTLKIDAKMAKALITAGLAVELETRNDTSIDVDKLTSRGI